MPRSRMIKTFAALLASMTAGTFLLESLYPGPNPFVPLAARTGPSAQAEVPELFTVPTILAGREGDWLAVVVHDCSEYDRDAQARRCHFLIGRDGRVAMQEPWRSQVDGGHLRVPGSDALSTRSIGISLDVDGNAESPSAAQMDALTALVRALQRRYHIDSGRVYLNRQLTGGLSPGMNFPEQQFRTGLLQTR